jgi:hypothetical protein
VAQTADDVLSSVADDASSVLDDLNPF